MTVQDIARLLTTSFFIMLARLSGAVLSLLTQIVLARTIPTEELGLYFFAVSIAAVVGTAAALGYPNAIPLLVARYQERARPELVAAFARTTHREVAKAALVAAALAVAAAFGATKAGPVVAVAALAIPAVALLRVNAALANPVRRFVLSFLPELLVRPLLFLALVLAMAALGVRISAVALGTVFSVIAVSVAAAQWWRLRPAFGGAPAPPSSARLIRQWRATARPLIVVGLFATLFADLVVVVAGLFLAASHLAVFTICAKIAFLVGFAVQLAHQLATPDLAASHARRESVAAPRILGFANLFAVAATSGALIVCILFGDLIMAVFGPAYRGAETTLVILVAAQFVRACFGPSLQLLALVGLQRPMAVVSVAAVVVLVGSNVLLAPFYGMAGAASAVALTSLFSAAALAFLLYRGAGLRADVLARSGLTRSTT